MTLISSLSMSSSSRMDLDQSSDSAGSVQSDALPADLIREYKRYLDRLVPSHIENMLGTNDPNKEYSIPLRIIDHVIGLQECLPEEFDGPLKPENYAERFHTSLWIEEAHRSIEMRELDILGSKLRLVASNPSRCSSTYMIEGKKDLSPRVDNFERLIILSSSGGVYRALNRFHDRFDTTEAIANLDQDTFDIYVVPDRVNFEQSHKALELFKSVKDVAFPSYSDTTRENLVEVSPGDFDLISSCQLDDEQKNICCRILSAKCRPAPFILTGNEDDTLSIIYAISSMLYIKTEGTRNILICTPSLDRAEGLWRAFYDSGDVPDSLVMHCGEDLNGSTMLGNDQYVCVLITTCVGAHLLAKDGASPKFDFIVIDEASKMYEPEVLIPLRFLRPDGCVVLAGDIDAGPECRSPIAASLGLDASIIERLMFQEPMYAYLEFEGEEVMYDDRYQARVV